LWSSAITQITTLILTINHNKNKREIGPNSNSQSVATQQLTGTNPSHEKNKRYRDSSHAALLDVFGFVDETAISSTRPRSNRLVPTTWQPRPLLPSPTSRLQGAPAPGSQPPGRHGLAPAFPPTSPPHYSRPPVSAHPSREMTTYRPPVGTPPSGARKPRPRGTSAVSSSISLAAASMRFARV
jgi:hypothetical protein